MVSKKSSNSTYALITGGSSGVGRCYALQLAERGYNILLVSNQADANEVVAREIFSQYGVEVKTMDIDLTQSDSIAEIVEFVESQAIDVGVLISNAGMLSFGGVTSTAPQTLERIISLHCTAATLLCREFSQRMTKKGVGYILMMSSSTAWMPYPTIATYSATKAYLKNFGRALWYEVRDRGVRVTVVFPGAVDTPLYKLDNGKRRRLVWWGVMSSPDKVAKRGLKALFAGRHRSIPSLFNKMCVVICTLLPAFMLLPILKIGRVRRLLD